VRTVVGVLVVRVLGGELWMDLTDVKKDASAVNDWEEWTTITTRRYSAKFIGRRRWP